MTLAERALRVLQPLPPEEGIETVAARLTGTTTGALAGFAAGDELTPASDRIDGSLLDTLTARALGGARGAVFTRPVEAHLLAVLGLARVAARRDVDEAIAIGVLAGLPGPRTTVARALDGARVLDPCCGAGALLVAALAIARRSGFRLVLAGRDVAPLAIQAARARLGVLGAGAGLAVADAFGCSWPACDLVLSNPPFVRHEALASALKARAARKSQLSRQADLSAHLAAVAIRHAPDVALVWPRALDTARSAEPLRADARARGGFAWRLRSRASGSFAVSVDTALAVWSAGHSGRPAAEASVALDALTPEDVAGLARGVSGARVAFRSDEAIARGRVRREVRLGDVCDVRFGMKSGCNGFFHLRRVGSGRFHSPLVGEVALAMDDVQPVLTSLREAIAPERAVPARELFRPARATATARAYVAAGEALGLQRRPTCRGRSPWWRVAGARAPAPVLYPAKIGARAFAFLNAEGWCEDKKWHALFPHDGLEPWILAVVLGATPIRLAIDVAARQLTGLQAIADVDCRVLAAAPFPSLGALASCARELDSCRDALRDDPVTTDVAAMIARPAQRELDAVVGPLLGMTAPEIAAGRRAMVARVAARLEHAAQVRAAIAANAARSWGA